ncbi:hypothetical protein, partial [Frankia sp. CpI1-P]|uniref:hypothetical protein n=1 Tax=Frankia sp. CpI1-P TaxID=1502734 RepID=UPI001A7E95D1
MSVETAPGILLVSPGGAPVRSPAGASGRAGPDRSEGVPLSSYGYERMNGEAIPESAFVYGFARPMASR